MIKIIIADDEENIRDIIADYIDNTNLGFRVVGRAENGSTALQLVKTLKPDILISDICMPGIDGLELIKEVNKMNLSVRYVIISGYNDFSYAKTAISLGVSEYLLKPFLPNDIMQILHRLKEDIERQGVLEKNLKVMQNELERNHMKEQEQYIRLVIEGNSDELTMLEERRRVGIDIKSDMYCVCEIRCNIKNGNNSQLRDLLEQLFYNLSESYFDSRICAYITMMKDDDIVVLFCGDYQADRSFRDGINAGLYKIKESAEKYYDISFECTVGNVCHKWIKIVDSYKEAQIVWKGTIDNIEAITFYYDYIKSSSSNFILNKEPEKPISLEKELLVQIQMSRKEDAFETIDSIVKYYSLYPLEMEGFVSISLVELVINISKAIKDAGGDFKIWENQELTDCLNNQFKKGGLTEIKGVLHNYVSKCCDEFAKLNEKQSDKIVYAVKCLIEKNISNDEFNLDAISSELYFSINYIRQVFKQKTDENILEYLIKRRMEKAGDLLLDIQDYKIVDVAEKTGYKNQRYFATTFKKYYNCTPSEFKIKGFENRV